MQVTVRPRQEDAGERRRILDERHIILVLFLALYARMMMGAALDQAVLRTWATVFVAIVIQALPFLVLGVLISGAISALVSPALLARLLPREVLLAVPAAALAGTALPGCECASVPVAGRLTARGVQPAAAVAFMLAAPAVNPVVMVATAVAFPGQPRMVAARFAGSLLTSMLVGLIWSRVRMPGLVERVLRRAGGDGPRWPAFSSAARHDAFEAGGWLMVGAAAAATLQVVVPRSALLTVAGHPALAALGLGLLAVMLAICSEADAFVAASLREFSLTARLVFLVVGPAVDVKLIAMQAGVFGRRFAVRFAPLTFAAAVACALLAAKVLL
jgi:uncharacterized protein